MNEERLEWEYYYEDGNHVSSTQPANRNTRSLRGAASPNPIAVVRKQDNVRFQIGDDVLLESEDPDDPFVGRIHGFDYSSTGFVEVIIQWYSRNKDIPTKYQRPDYAPNELYFTIDTDKNDIETLINHCSVLSPEKYRTSTDPVKYFVQYGFNSSTGSFTDPIDWSELTKIPQHKLFEVLRPIMDKTIKSTSTSSKKNVSEVPAQPQDVFSRSKSPEESLKKTDSPPLKRKRGRAKKDTTKPVNAEEPKKRGRKKKEEIPLDEDEDVVLVEPEDQSMNLPESSGVESAYEESENEQEEYDEEEDDFEAEEALKSKRSPRKTQPTSRSPKKQTSRQPSKTEPNIQSKNMKNLIMIRSRAPRRMVQKATFSVRPLPQKSDDLIEKSAQQVNDYDKIRDILHVSSVPDALPCREKEYSRIYLCLDGAIRQGTGTCLYVNGTPGTGKTATVREVILQLQMTTQMEGKNRLPPFSCLEINGMKLINPAEAYEILWHHISGVRVSAANAAGLLEQEFKSPKNKNRQPIVVLMDELDQLVTKNQNVMYNFFNWPSLPESQLIVIAISNTMDLPERILTNKISSRMGLTRITFEGYKYEQLIQIITARLNKYGHIFQPEAIELASRKVASVNGDARRALDFCRRAVELALEDPDNKDDGTVKFKHVKMAIDETTNSPMFIYLQELPFSSKILLSAVMARIRRSGINENPMSDIIEETQQLCKISKQSEKIMRVLYENGTRIRMNGLTKSIAELVEGGILIQQNMKGERCPKIRLAIAQEEIKMAFRTDRDMDTLI